MSRRVMSLALLMVLLLGGCTNRLILPEAPSSPVTVYLMDHGRHASLILPGGEAQWTRYVHGEWRWYALDDTGLWRGIQALLWPTDATIGRRGLTRLPTPGRPSPAIPEGFLRLYPLTVEAGRVSALRARLDRHFHSAATSHLQPRYNLVFVPYPRPYWVFHHSNEVMAQWLRALGVEVRGSAMLSRWRLEGPPTSSTARPTRSAVTSCPGPWCSRLKRFVPGGQVGVERYPATAPRGGAHSHFLRRNSQSSETPMASITPITRK